MILARILSFWRQIDIFFFFNFPSRFCRCRRSLRPRRYRLRPKTKFLEFRAVLKKKCIFARKFSENHEFRYDFYGFVNFFQKKSSTWDLRFSMAMDRSSCVSTRRAAASASGSKTPCVICGQRRVFKLVSPSNDFVDIITAPVGSLETRQTASHGICSFSSTTIKSPEFNCCAWMFSTPSFVMRWQIPKAKSRFWQKKNWDLSEIEIKKCAFRCDFVGFGNIFSKIGLWKP